MKQTILRLFILLILSWIEAKSYTQSNSRLIGTEKALKESFALVMQDENDSLRMILSMEFQSQLLQALSEKGALDYPWDSLKSMARLESPDHSFRLFNWNVPLSGGRNRYFCILAMKCETGKDSLIMLHDSSDLINDPEHFTGKADRWFGCLYYKIIPFTSSPGQKSYLLFGWDGISRDVNSKLIEVLEPGKSCRPEFGARVFPGYLDGIHSRIIFRYSSETGMILKYGVENIHGKPSWNKKKKVFTDQGEKRLMITCDHLVPLEPGLEGQYRFYVPSSEVFDGFVYDHFMWRFISEMDARDLKN